MKTLHFIVNGEDVPVDIEDPEALPLEWAMRRALCLSHNTSRPSPDWELRHESGQLVDGSICCAKALERGYLFLTLRVSAGGLFAPKVFREGVVVLREPFRPNTVLIHKALKRAARGRYG
jgi:hypothetical protein